MTTRHHTNAWTNWSGNQRAIAARVARPRTTEEVADVIRRAVSDGLTVKAVGSGHSFAAVAATVGVRIELDQLESAVTVLDQADGLVRAPAGMTLRELNSVLDTHGLAIANLGDSDAQTIAGALATATHGTAGGLGGICSAVAGLVLVTASGEALLCSATQNPEIFAAARVGLGALGVVTEVTLRCVPSFNLRADERLAPLDDVLAGVSEHLGANDHVGFAWFPHTDLVWLRRYNRVSDHHQPLSPMRRWVDESLVARAGNTIACQVALRRPALTPAISRIGAKSHKPRVFVDSSHRVFCTIPPPPFLAMEYAVAREKLVELFAGVRSIAELLPVKALVPVEIRFSAPEDAWLSPAFGRDTAYVAVRQHLRAPYEEYFLRVEALAASLGGRPHWGKLHWRDAASLAPVYPRFADYLAVRDRLDPNRLFSNPYLERILGP